MRPFDDRVMAVVAALGALPATVLAADIVAAPMLGRRPLLLQSSWLPVSVPAAIAGMLATLAGARGSRSAFQTAALALTLVAVFWAAGQLYFSVLGGAEIPGVLSGLATLFFLLPLMLTFGLFPLIVPAVALGAAMAALTFGLRAASQ